MKRAAPARLLFFALLCSCEESTSGADMVAFQPTATSSPTAGAPSMGGSGGAVTGGSTGEGGSGNVGGGTVPDLATAVALVAAAECGIFDDCTSLFLDRLYGGYEGCIERAVLAYGWEALLPSTGYTPQGLTECALARSTQTCLGFFSYLDYPAECAPLGMLPLGASCLAHTQCASGFCPSSDFSCAMCAQPLEGMPCPTGACPLGMLCASGQCAVPARLGEACSSTRPCDTWLICDEVCTSIPSTLNAACGTSVGLPYCDQRYGLLCTDQASGMCAPYLTVGSGQACGWDGSSTFYICSDSGWCTDGYCVDSALPGEACSLVSGPSCTWPDVCSGDVCVSPRAPESCP